MKHLRRSDMISKSRVTGFSIPKLGPRAPSMAMSHTYVTEHLCYRLCRILTPVLLSVSPAKASEGNFA